MDVNIMVKIRHGGHFPLGYVEEYIGGTFNVVFIKKEALNMTKLRDIVLTYGYNSVAGLYYGIPGLGLGNGGLKCLKSDYCIKVMVEHAEKNKAIEIFVVHGIDEAIEVDASEVLFMEGVSQPITQASQDQVQEAIPPNAQVHEDVPSEAQKVHEGTHMYSTPIKQTNVGNVARRRKITPKRKSTTAATSKDGVIHEAAPDPLHKTSNIPEQSSTSSESDDSVEDENYKIDPREDLDDDECEDIDFVDEFNQHPEGRRRRLKRKNNSQGSKFEVNVQENVAQNIEVPNTNEEPLTYNESTAETENVYEDVETAYQSADSVEAPDDYAQEALSNEDDELHEIRQCIKELLNNERGRIAVNSGARLTNDNDGPPMRVNNINAPNVDEGIPSHSHEATFVQAEGLSTENAPMSSRGTTANKSKWPPYWTTYEGGYESDPRESDDEEPLVHSDDEASVNRRMLKKKKKIKYSFFNEEVDMKAVQLTPGLMFTSRKILKEAILNYSIQQHYDLLYLKNDKKRINIGCSLCHWELNAGPEGDDEDAWQIKSISRHHTCSRTFKNGLITEN